MMTEPEGQPPTSEGSGGEPSRLQLKKKLLGAIAAKREGKLEPEDIQTVNLASLTMNLAPLRQRPVVLADVDPLGHDPITIFDFDDGDRVFTF